MSKKLVEYDETTGRRLDLNQEKLKESGQKMLDAIEKAEKEPDAIDYSYLKELANQAIAGQMTKPQPQGEYPAIVFKDGYPGLSEEVHDAWGTFSFYAYGLLYGDPGEVEHRDGKAYIWIDDENPNYPTVTPESA